MRLMSPTLEAAMRAADAEPYVRVRVADLLAGVRRLRMATLYEGGEPDAPHGAGCCADGSLIRAYRESLTQVRYQRIPPGGGAWGTWSSAPALGSGVWCQAAAGGDYAIVAADEGSNVSVLSSADSGATWSGWAAAVTGGSTVGPVACGQRADGDAAVFWVEAGVLYGARRTAGVWGAPSASTLAFTTLTGLGGCFDGADWALAIAGTDLDGLPAVWTARWGDDGALARGVWEDARVLIWADSADLAYLAPNISRVDTYRVSLVEQWTGAGAYVLNLVTWPPLLADWEDNAWREPLPLPSTVLNGVAIPGTAAKAYQAAPALVREAVLPDPAGVDYSDRVLLAEWEEPGRVKIVLDNAAGDLTSAIPPGGELQVIGGYRTAAGQEIPFSGPYATYWIDRIRVEEAGGRNTVVVEGGDIWSLLDGWVARRQEQYAAGAHDIASIVRRVCARAGIGFALAASSAEILSTSPAFTLPAGIPASAAIRRLFRFVLDSPVQDGALLRSTLTDPADSAVYAYGGAHGISGYTRETAVVRPAFVRALAGAAVGQARDDAAIEDGGDTGRIIVDRALASAAEAAIEAEAFLRQARRHAVNDELVAFPNVAQTPLDVVTVTAPRAGLVDARRRVLRIRTRYDRRTRLAYEQRLTLGAP